ncbi:hypothetical protein E1B28_002504 [Marasmius oreades]|uniref:tRNA-splicing endonuclease subunit Sen15 domain-containing protein n=1 Tax=Marasmius oreades TaxID=181124 RepID=A0A9P7ULU0_9AGAR|nr:uncharacterized protein E1B28_002504 [Marasmius oreades]KAG7086555.1 hypothetical protein E1B28_002504 [Marasmius oreades]
MENHPSYPELSSLISEYPKHAGALFQTYNDLLLAQQWRDVEVQDLGAPHLRGYILGRRPVTATDADALLYVVPCSVTESISVDWLAGVFEKLATEEIYLAINTDDSSVVYYQISDGIVKPFI